MDLQAVAATGWGFAERAYIGGWEVRAASGHTSRANAALPLGDSGMPLPQTLEAVREWFAERALPGLVQTIDGSPLDREIADLGFTETHRPALRQTAPLGPALETLKSSTDAHHVAEVTTELPEDYFAAYLRGRGIPEFKTLLTSGDALIAFAVVRGDTGQALSVGRVAIDTGTGYAGIAAIATAEAARRRGLARIVMRDLLAFAAEHGAESTYLEVEDGNAPALALYASLGYTTAHRYHCRRL
ncbi:GNAT family N-acetyltransferase [Catenulispora pinisilvae]|uniref:GNAT family N-acetyltransferase n=1 Tax=Catenulispora pinisilvae TaxID=2705253 RepID=UPI0018911776|nr:GNAT family N-acetyltransferase [Catenulispora pinisilvae]